MSPESEAGTLGETILKAASEGSHVIVELTNGETYRAYILADFEMQEPEWERDEGYFTGTIEFDQVIEPDGLDDNQYPTELGYIGATITSDGWEEVKLATQVQRVEEDELIEWNGISLGEIEAIEIVESTDQ